MGNVGWINIIMAGWPALSVLLIMSIISIKVIWERYGVFKKIQTNTGSFLTTLKKNGRAPDIIAWCERSSQPLAKIAKNVFKTSPQRVDKERALSRTIQELVQELETGVSLLGTIASVAPFVGLLGTVIGIIRAFRGVSMAANAGPGIVALGISEALVGTAAGLVVAIPALMGYNYFVNRIRRLTQSWELVGSDLIDMSLGQRS